MTTSARVVVNGREFDADAVVALMDDGLREALHTQQEWTTEQAFVDAYCDAHREKFGEAFAVN